MTDTTEQPITKFDITKNDRENRENWLRDACELILTDILLPAVRILDQLPETAGKFDLDANYNVSIGTLSNSTKVLGICYPRSFSQAGTNEIFVSPFCDDSKTILGILCHELIHHLNDNRDKHGVIFKRLAVKAGLEGKMTETVAGDELNEYFDEVIDMLGNIPHCKLDITQKPTQKGRMRKVACTSCDFTFNTSRKQISNMKFFDCLVCSGELVPHLLPEDMA